MDKNTTQKIKEILKKVGEDEASFIMELAIKRQIQMNINEMYELNCLEDIKDCLEKRISYIKINY